jgi:type VI secretion system protein ImpL
MKLLAAIFKYGLLALALCLLLVGLTLLAWWLQWPLITGGVVLLGFFGLALAFFVLRAVWRWRNKKSFVSSVLKEQNKYDNPQGTGNRLHAAWQSGYQVLQKSPVRFKERAEYAQPWYLALDNTGALSTIYDAKAQTVPLALSQPPLLWHFRPTALVLHLTQHTIPQESLANTPDPDWESFLVLLTEKKQHIPLQGLLVNISLRDLVQQSPENISCSAARIRAHIQHIALALGKNFPVYCLLEDMDELKGMQGLLERIPEEYLPRFVGSLLQPQEANPAQNALATAAKQLRQSIDACAAHDSVPCGDDLLAVEALPALEKNLAILLDGIGGEVAHQLQPDLRGVFFVQEKSADTHNPLFIEGFFNAVLAKEKQRIPSLEGRFALHASTRLLGYAAWLCFTACLCGLMAVNTVYQHNVFQRLKAMPPQPVEYAEKVNTLYMQMTRIQNLEAARNAWILPVIGQDYLQRVMQELKASYTSTVYTQLLAPTFAQYKRKFAQATGAQNKQQAQQAEDTLKELIWYNELLIDKMQGTVDLKKSASSFPLTASNEKEWTVVHGMLIAHAIQWIDEKQYVETMVGELRTALTSLFIINAAALQDFSSFDSGHQQYRICVSDYWTAMPQDTEQNYCVPPRHTAKGYAYFSNFLEDSLVLAEKTPELTQALQRLCANYLKEYEISWKAFIAAFYRSWNKEFRASVYNEVANMRQINTYPHIKFFTDLKTQLAPLIENPQIMPRWLQDYPLLSAMVDLALLQGATDGTRLEEKNFWMEMISLLANSPQTLQALRAQSNSAAHLRNILQSTEYLRRFFTNVRLLLRDSTNSPTALALAEQLYTGKHSTEENANNYIKAEQNLKEVLEVMSDKTSDSCVQIMRDLLYFSGQAVVIQAGNELQNIWNNEVLTSPEALYHADDRTILYGEKGLVPTFINAHLKPFVARDTLGMVAKTWLGLSFPFTTDFLRSLTGAEQISAHPAKEQYTVLLRSSPTLVTPSATVRPDSTTITLQDSTASTLVNRNYPKAKQFVYSPKTSGMVTVEIAFPAFSVQYSYQDFLTFLAEYQYGEHVYAAADFPDKQAMLNDAGIQEITVRILPDNAVDLLQQSEIEHPVLQDRITYTAE